MIHIPTPEIKLNRYIVNFVKTHEGQEYPQSLKIEASSEEDARMQINSKCIANNTECIITEIIHL